MRSKLGVVLLLLLNVVLPTVFASSVSLDIGAKQQHQIGTLAGSGKVGIKTLLNSAVALTGLIVFGVSLLLTIIWGILTAFYVRSDIRSRVYKQLVFMFIFSGAFLVFFAISYLGGAVWLAPVVEVEFWFMITFAIAFSFYILGWSIRVGDDDGRREDMSSVTAGEALNGRSVWWMFITALVFISAAFVVWDITASPSYTLTFGIIAIALFVFWVLWFIVSWMVASKGATTFGGRAVSPSRYTWLQYFHIVIVVLVVFVAVCFIIGPAFQLTTITYADIMWGYWATVTLIAITQHVLYFVFDFHRRSREETAAQSSEMAPAQSRFGMPAIAGSSNSVFNTYGKTKSF